MCVCVCVCVYIYIYISCHDASTDFPDYLQPFSLYLPSLPAGLLKYTMCPYRAVVAKFLLVVQHLHVLVKGPIEKDCL